MTHAIRLLVAICLLATATAATQVADDEIDLNGVTEKHVMVPMRDGVKLSVYLYFPEGEAQ